MEIERKIYWLQHIIDQKREAIHDWRVVAATRNICDNLGRSPIDKLENEIFIAKELITMCEKEMVNDDYS